MAPMSGGTTSHPRSDGAIRAGTVIGRYVVIERLGIGGMGVVLSAYDPKLDRKVAVKLLRGGRRDGTEGEIAQQRLLREAQAMARLDHPNVVAVHDVGTHEGTVFAAMEFVRGQTLRAWAEHEGGPRPWADVLDVMRQAAWGLIAAHDGGLIHRDFKPDNVMIGEDGRVRVMDFGLVRAEREMSEPLPVLADGAVVEPGIRTEEEVAADAMDRIRAQLAGMGKLGSDDVAANADTLSGDDVAIAAPEPERAFEHSLTRTGALLGTPAYMAPEQIEGVAVDARTDQFAFCVTLFEMLYGERPFAGETWTALAASILQATIVEPKSDPGVPPWLRSAVMRGLARRPEDRFPDLRALLAALDPGRRSNARWAAAAFAGAAVVAVGVLAAGGDDPCDGAANEIADVWNEARGGALRRRFAGLDLAYAADAADRTVEGLDGYAGAWVAQWEAACRATQDGAQTQGMLDRRMACLDGRRRSLRALTKVLLERDGVVEQAVDGVARLPEVARCGDLEALTSDVEPPNAAVAAKVTDVRARLADVEALETVGRYAEGVELADGLLAEARAIDYDPLVAEVALAVGTVLDLARRPRDAVEALRLAAAKGRASGADEVAAAAEVRLVFVTGVRLDEGARGRWWAEHAAAAIARAGDDGVLEARRLNYLGVTLHLGGEVEEGGKLLQQAVAAHEARLGPDHPYTLEALHNLGLNLARAGKHDEALAAEQDVLRRYRARYGDAHPKVAECLGAVANVKYAGNDLEGAAADLRQALEILDRAGETDTLRAGYVLAKLASARAGSDAHAQARELLARARRIFVRDLGEEHPQVDRVDANAAAVASREGKAEEAAQLYEQVAARQRKRLGADHPDLGKTLRELARAQLVLGRRETAVQMLVESERILAASGEPAELDAVRAVLAEARGDG